MTSTMRRRTASPGHDAVPVSSVEIDPSRTVQYGIMTQIVRGLLYVVYIFTSSCCIHAAQLLGAPLYFINRENYYAFMAVTKQHFALLMITATQWWSPTLIRISGDASVKGQLRKTQDGRFEADFPERMILVANHQLYTDWLYLWWVAYASGLHGHLYIILKQSLKWVPLFGPAMQFYSFIFLARKWSSDQQRMSYRLRKLKLKKHFGNNTYLDPMWLVLFPEGTNLSDNGRTNSARWAKKNDIADCRHTLLPRHTGLQFCLEELSGSVEYVYDCTIAYEHIPAGQFGQDIFTLRSICLEGRPPKSVNMHWRRFKVTDIPYKDSDAMGAWTLARWREKDDLLDYHLMHGNFPADAVAIAEQSAETEGGFITTYVKPKSPLEFLQMYVPLLAVWLLIGILYKMWNLVMTGRLGGHA